MTHDSTAGDGVTITVRPPVWGGTGTRVLVYASTDSGPVIADPAQRGQLYAATVSS